MEVEGIFILNPDTHKEQRIKNRLVSHGAQGILKSWFQQDAGPLVFWIGVTGSIYRFDNATLELIANGEPFGGGYDRLLLNRSDIDWDVALTNGFWRARSKTVTWSITLDWTKVWSRLFLTDVEAGTDGNVYSLSGPTAEPQRSRVGDPDINVAYEFWIRG
jgi:hypothetical protein